MVADMTSVAGYALSTSNKNAAKAKATRHMSQRRNMTSRMRNPDSDGRYTLSEREYYALRELFGIVSTFSEKAGELEARARTIQGGWRDMRMIQSVGAKLMGEILKTVPRKKLAQISRELHNTEVVVSVNRSICGEPGEREENLTCVPQRALERITQKAVESECMFCEKCGADVKRCQLRKDIEATYMFDLPGSKTECPYAGLVITEGRRDEDSIQAKED